MQLHLKNWIDKYGGIPAIAKELEVTEWTVRVWLRGDGSPSAMNIMKLIVLSKGKLSFQQIYKETSRNLVKRHQEI